MLFRSKIMNLHKKISEYWNYLEKKYPTPHYVGKIKIIEFNILKKAVDKKNEIFLKKIIKNMYVKKEAYIVKNCADKNLKKITLNLVEHYKKTKKPNFHKMLDGTPNFHRMIDKKITKKALFFSRIHPIKGLKELILAWSKSNFLKDWSIVIVTEIRILQEWCQGVEEKRYQYTFKLIEIH